MSQEKTTKVVGLTFLEGLTLVFIHAKLFNVIAWSWWLVLLPMLLQIGLALVLLLMTFGVKVIRKVTTPNARIAQALEATMQR